MNTIIKNLELKINQAEDLNERFEKKKIALTLKYYEIERDEIPESGDSNKLKKLSQRINNLSNGESRLFSYSKKLNETLNEAYEAENKADEIKYETEDKAHDIFQKEYRRTNFNY